MLKFIILAAALTVPMSTLHAQNLQQPQNGGTLPLDDIEANDGTLPLRLPNDGTLPLKFTGDAVSQGAGSRVQTNVTITNADRHSLPVAQQAQLVCQQSGNTVSKHAAKGSMTISGESYQIKGICYDHNTKKMEIVGIKGANAHSFMIGTLPNPEPTSFAGSLIVSTNATTRYNFNMRTHAE